MNKILFLLSVFFLTNFAEAQRKNRFENYLNTKKLGTIYKGVKPGERDKFFRQYFLVQKVEELQAYPNISKIKPEILYAFVKDTYPPIETKSLSPEDKKLREDALLSINYLFNKKDLKNPLLVPNVESYIDPGNRYYFLKILPISVTENIPKEIYSYTNNDVRNSKQETNYFWINKKKEIEKVNIFPSIDNKKFWNRVHTFLPNYTFSSNPATFSKPFKDQTLYVITPFPRGLENIEYRTKDFKDFIVSRYMDESGIWRDIEQ